MNKKVNILHLVFNLNVGGLERVVIQLLKEMDRDKFSPAVACLMNGGNLVKEIEQTGIGVEILNKPDKLDFSVSIRLARILRERKIKLIHTHNTGAFLYGSIAAKLAGVPAIIHTEHGRILPDKKRLMLAERILSSFAFKIVAVSQDLKNSLVRFEKIRPEKIQVVPNGVDVDLFKPMAEDTVSKKRHEFGLNKDNFIIGSVGRLVEVKGHKSLIKAFSLAQRAIPGAKLAIAGDGPLKEELVDFSRNIGVEKNILFLGERGDIPEILNVFDIFALPSKSEGVSLTLLEAMATNKPIIATDAGGNKEIIEDGVDGYLVPAENPEKLSEAILYLAKNPRDAAQLADSAYKKACQRYSLKNTVNSYQDIYESALMRN